MKDFHARYFVLLAFTVVAAAAQPIGFGLKLGAPLTDAVNLAAGNGTLTSTATKFTIGPMVELRLPFGVGVEADFLYRRVSGTYNSSVFSADAHGNEWDVPILLKYRFPFPIVKPYLEAGPSFRWLTNVDHGYTCASNICTGIAPPQFSTSTSGAGLTLGGGVEVKLLLIRIAPELRYTRWGSEAFSLQSAGTTFLNTNQNQAEFLVGISF
jgi:opacity protein-like surface antigen